MAFAQRFSRFMIDTSRPAKKKRLFPMHLTPFETYMLMDDRPEYPMTFIVQLGFSGEVHREIFEESIDLALQRHPLLRAIVQPAKQDRDCWVCAKGIKPYLHWGPLNEPISFQRKEFINIREELGLRIWVRSSSEYSVVTFQFHHATTDGIGSYQYIGDLLYFYASKSGDDFDQPLPEIDQSVLRERLRSSFPVEKFVDENGKFRFEWRETAKMLLGSVAVLKTPTKTANGSGTTSFPGIQSHVFEKNAYKQLRLKAQEYGQTPNDFLLEKLFVTLHQWNSQNGISMFPRQFCVLLPMDLREHDTPDFPATNVVTYTLVRRPARVIRDHQKLVETLRVETTMLKNNRQGTAFMNMIAGSYRYQRTMKLILSGKCLATAVMSNTGDPTRHFNVTFPKDQGMVRCGNLRLETISGVPPMRKNTRLTISAFTYRRVLKICLRCDPHYFSDADAKKFLNLFIAELSK